MRRLSPEQVARFAGAQLIAAPVGAEQGPDRVVIDSREAGEGALFVGLPGERVHGGRFAADALAAGAWGVLSDPEHVGFADAGLEAGYGAVMSAADPLGALQRLARSWRRELGAKVVGVTGSTGKTSTKDLLLAVLGPHRRTVASRANFNTEIGLPLELLSAPPDTEVIVLEMGMRGPGQIAELVEIAEPDVGVIVSVGPVHLELLGSLENIAAAKAELIRDLRPGAAAVVPFGEPLLEPHLRDDIETVSFGPGGDVSLVSSGDAEVEIESPAGVVRLQVPFTQPHLRRNLLAAVAVAELLGVQPAGEIALELSPGRGQRRELGGGVTLIDDCYNANPMSMRAALDDLADVAGRAGRGERDGAGGGDGGGRRRVAVLGDMLELGDGAVGFHREIGVYAIGRADALVTVGPLARSMADAFGGEVTRLADAEEAARRLPELLRDGDVVLLKASNGVGLRRVADALLEGAPA